ncbi:MAG TPA: hypothetical protein VIV40_07170 [Kofleriaceae bacterium]
MMRSAFVLLVLVIAGACSKTEQKETGTVIAPRMLESATFELPQGWTSAYGKDDAWQFASADARTKVRFERTDERFIASPDAFMQHVAPRYGKDKLVTIEQRDHSGKGFAITLAVFAGESDPQPQHTTFVVRPLGKVWFSCYADGLGLEDEPLRNQVVALCRSVRL